MKGLTIEDVSDSQLMQQEKLVQSMDKQEDSNESKQTYTQETQEVLIAKSRENLAFLPGILSEKFPLSSMFR